MLLERIAAQHIQFSVSFEVVSSHALGFVRAPRSPVSLGPPFHTIILLLLEVLVLLIVGTPLLSLGGSVMSAISDVAGAVIPPKIMSVTIKKNRKLPQRPILAPASARAQAWFVTKQDGFKSAANRRTNFKRSLLLANSIEIP